MTFTRDAPSGIASSTTVLPVFKMHALSESERDELRRLRKKTAQQEIDLEIRRKAAAYFARETSR